MVAEGDTKVEEAAVMVEGEEVKKLCILPLWTTFAIYSFAFLGPLSFSVSLSLPSSLSCLSLSLSLSL